MMFDEMPQRYLDEENVFLSENLTMVVTFVLSKTMGGQNCTHACTHEY